MDSVPQKVLQIVAGRLFAGVGFCSGRPGAADKFKILAIVRLVFFGHRIGAPLATLMGHTRIVVRAIQADLHIAAALVATLRAARLAGQRVFPAAIVAMPRHTGQDTDGRRDGKSCL